MAYVTIPDSDIDPESALVADLFTRIRDNPLAIAQGDAGAPKIQQSALYNTGALPGTNYASAGGGSTTLGTFTEVNNIRMVRGGTFRFLQTVKTSNASFAAHARIYKNGVAAGIDHSTTSTTGSDFTDDIAVSSGDTVQTFAYTAGATATVSQTKVGTSDVPVLLQFFAMANGDR